MKDIKAIILLVLGAILSATAFAFKDELGKAVFAIILIIGWILLLASIILQIRKKRAADGKTE